MNYKAKLANQSNILLKSKYLKKNRAMNTEESSILLKSKRDQYMIQIRKQKNEMMIETKRQKLTNGSSFRVGHIDPIFQQTNLEVRL